MHMEDYVLVIMLKPLNQGKILTRSSGNLSKKAKKVMKYNYAMAMMKSTSLSLLLVINTQLKSS